jgi:protein TonB
VTTLPPRRAAAPDIAETVLGEGNHRQVRRLPLALLAACLVHAVVVGVAHRSSAGRRESPSATPAPRPAIEIALAAPPPPAPERRDPPAKPTPAGATHALRFRSAPAAQAATVIAPPVESAAPVDLTADTVVTGKAIAYAGGVTAPGGTSSSPVAAAPGGRQTHLGTSSAATGWMTPVSLPSENWSCPWPSEAGAEQIDEQTVILRVFVTASGDAQSAELLADPGHGFGPAALACAMRTRFTPALDTAGRAMAARSPPIRVRFTR